MKGKMMNFDRLVSRGHEPWQPSPDATDGEVWFEYDFPAAGSYVIDGQRVMYAIAVGSPDDLSVWAYLLLPDDDPLLTATFDDGEALFAAIDARLAGQRAVFALARNSRIEFYSDAIEVPKAANSLDAGAAMFLRLGERDAAQTQEDAARALQELVTQ
jgi:hypothetical protein